MRSHRQPALFTIVVATLMHMGTAWASQGSEIIVDLAAASQTLRILPRKSHQEDQAYMLRFVILPRQYTASAKLEILFEWPAEHLPDNIIYEVHGSIRDWPIEDYSYRTEKHFDIYLPALHEGRRAEVVLGWVGAPFDESSAYALLTTDGTQAIQQWKGWKIK